ncbi:MAG: hypothetical protein MOGMAGMI_00187 [Candidatus Omnitrophica bacterium]|nr:hypothetical protein [Candidatus Omnitrophota bacterium]
MELSARARARASIVARARFIEDLVGEAAVQGVSQYVLLGAGLDTYAQRRPAGSPPLVVYEVDREGPQVWKRRRLVRLGYAEPEWLKFVPVDLVQDARWVEGLIGAGYAVDQAAVVAAAGLSMYLERPALLGLLGRSARLAPGSTLVMSYLVPLDRVDEEERQDRQSTEKFARAAGTPFVGCYAPEEMRELVLRAGFARVRTVSGKDLERMFFAGRSDGLRPSSSEELVVAEV